MPISPPTAISRRWPRAACRSSRPRLSSPLWWSSAKRSAPKEHAKGDFEVYDYPGRYRVRTDGEVQARVRLEQRQDDYEEGRGHTNARAFTLGALVELTEHPREDQNREYLITFTEVSISGHQLQTGAGRRGLRPVAQAADLAGKRAITSRMSSVWKGFLI